jgi:hypothetical protein
MSGVLRRQIRPNRHPMLVPPVEELLQYEEAQHAGQRERSGAGSRPQPLVGLRQQMQQGAAEHRAHRKRHQQEEGALKTRTAERKRNDARQRDEPDEQNAR